MNNAYIRLKTHFKNYQLEMLLVVG